MSIAAAHAVRADFEAAPMFDRWLSGVFVALLCFGTVMVYSATVASPNKSLAPNFHHVSMHAAHAVAAFALALAVATVPMAWWERLARPLLLLTLLSLAVVLVPGIGVEVNGARRWLIIGGLRMQPSELTKVVLVIYSAAYLARQGAALRDFTRGVLMILIVLAVTALLLVLEPDFGSSFVISVTVVAMLFLGGIRFRHFLMLFGVAASALAVLVVIAPYRLARVTGFANPFADPYGSGFQLAQALIAFGRGEWFGMGLGASIQKLYFLPHAETDFLLAVIAEELGAIAVLIVIALFGVLLWRAFVIARQAERRRQIFPARLAQGLGVLLVGQAMIAIGVNLGMFPTKGLTLPFLSYGGSSLMASGIAMGLLQSVYRSLRREPGDRA
jgi:cell division protein FtsW